MNENVTEQMKDTNSDWINPRTSKQETHTHTSTQHHRKVEKIRDKILKVYMGGKKVKISNQELSSPHQQQKAEWNLLQENKCHHRILYPDEGEEEKGRKKEKQGGYLMV